MRIGDLSLACSIRKRGRDSRTAVCTSTGMFTRPNESAPLQIARAMLRARVDAYRLIHANADDGSCRQLHVLPVGRGDRSACADDGTEHRALHAAEDAADDAADSGANTGRAGFFTDATALEDLRGIGTN